MYVDESDRRNASGCADPTYSEVVEQVKRDGRKNMSRCIRVMLAVATAMGCDVINRIELRDRASGEVSR